VLATTVLGSSLAFVDGTVVNLALPALQRELGATVADVQWVVEAYALLLAALLLVGGSLGDRLGRRRIYASGIVLFAAASSACGLARGVRQLVIARAVQGVGAALLVPGSLAILSASFPEQERGRAIGTWSAASAITTARNARRSTLFIRRYGLGADAGVYGTLVSPDNEITGIFAAPTYPTGGTREDPLLRRLQAGSAEG